MTIVVHVVELGIVIKARLVVRVGPGIGNVESVAGLGALMNHVLGLIFQIDRR